MYYDIGSTKEKMKASYDKFSHEEQREIDECANLFVVLCDAASQREELE